MTAIWFRAGAALAFLSVAGGAFGAHGLRELVSTEALGWWETGARYALSHAIALLAVAWLADRAPGRAVHVAGGAMLVGWVALMVAAGGLSRAPQA